MNMHLIFLCTLLVFFVSTRIEKVTCEWFDFTEVSGEIKGSWSALSCSADGSKMVAAIDYGSLYTSSNSGETWVVVDNTGVSDGRRWSALTSSANGRFIFAAMGDMGYIYSSSDYGISFLAHEDLGSQMWSAVACSIDCSHVVATFVGGNITFSSDYGVTWAYYQPTLYSPWTSVASNSDGTRYFAGTFGGELMISYDAGNSWSAMVAAGSREWCSVSSSYDGLKLIAGTCSEYLYMSIDGGVTWTNNGVRGHWRSLSTSADGSVVVAAADYNGDLIASFDYGESWVTVTPHPTGSGESWACTALTSDGNLLAAAVASPNGSIYLGQEHETAVPSTSAPSSSFSPTVTRTQYPTPHRMIATSCPSTSAPTSTPSSSVPSSFPSCSAGSFSFGEPLNCSMCPPGTHSNIERRGERREPNSNSCSPCLDGFYSNNFGSVSCTPCEWPYDSLPGSTSCNGIFLNVHSRYYLLFVVIYVATFIGTILSINGHNRCFATILIAFPVIEYTTGVFYVLECRFYTLYLFVWGVLTIFLPALSFVRYLTVSRGYPRLWHSWMSTLLWLGIDGGLPVIKGHTFSCFGLLLIDALVPGRNFYHHLNSVVGCLFLPPIWGVLCVVQLFSAVVLFACLVLSAIFIACWFLIGIYFFQMKSFVSGKIWNFWLLIWTNDKRMEAKLNLDIAFLQEASFSEYVFHTMPQLCFQVYNFHKLGRVSKLGGVSLGVTIVMALYGTYRVVYLYCFRKIPFYTVPLVPSCLGRRYYFEEEAVQEEYEEHMLGHESRIARRDIFVEMNPMISSNANDGSEFQEKDAINPLSICIDQEGLWGIIIQSKLVLEQRSEFRLLGKLNSMLKRLSISSNEDFHRLNSMEINQLSTIIPDELIESFDRFCPITTTVVEKNENEKSLMDGSGR